MVGRDQSFHVDQGLHDEGLSLSLFMSVEAITAAEHTTSTPSEHAMLHHVSAVPRDGAVGVSYLLCASSSSSPTKPWLRPMSVLVAFPG